jgi:hypothetical protein
VGWSYRKSFRAGPFRVNVSKSGIGYSAGGRGFRTGVRASGRRYTSMSVPGTGVRYTKTVAKGSSGCLLVVAGWTLVVGVAGLIW